MKWVNKITDLIDSNPYSRYGWVIIAMWLPTMWFIYQASVGEMPAWVAMILPTVAIIFSEMYRQLVEKYQDMTKDLLEDLTKLVKKP